MTKYGITIKQFQQFFSNEDACKHYLFDFKWKEGYRCRRCRATKCEVELLFNERAMGGKICIWGRQNIVPAMSDLTFR